MKYILCWWRYWRPVTSPTMVAIFAAVLDFTKNRPLPSSKNPLFQNEARCTTFLVKMSFICMRMKNDFHIKGWAPTLVLKQRPGGTRKWPIRNHGKTGRNVFFELDITHKDAFCVILSIIFTFIVERTWEKMHFHSQIVWPSLNLVSNCVRGLKGMQSFKLVCERATISQCKVYERGTFSVKNGM